MTRPVKWRDFLSDFERKLRKYPTIIVPVSKRRQLFSELFQRIKDKVATVPDPPAAEPVKKGYVIISKTQYDKLFDKNGNPKSTLKSWQRKIAKQDWESRRKSLDGKKAIFRVEFDENELKEYLRFVSKLVHEKSSFELEDPKSDKDGVEELRKHLNSNPEWEEPETGG